MNQDAREPGHAEGLALGRICHGRGACEQDAREPGHAEKDSRWAGYAMDMEHASRMHVNSDTRVIETVDKCVQCSVKMCQTFIIC